MKTKSYFLYSLLFLCLILPNTSYEDVQTGNVGFQQALNKYRLHAAKNKWAEALIVLEELEKSHPSDFLQKEEGHYITVNKWATQERASVIASSKIGYEEYQKELNDLISQMEEHNLWREDPNGAWELAKERVLKLAQTEDTETKTAERKALLERSWKDRMKNFGPHITNLKDQEVYEHIATPQQKVKLHQGLADEYFESSNRDCKISLPYWEKAWEGIRDLSKGEQEELDDFKWGKKDTALKLFHCYQESGDDKNASSFLKQLNAMGVSKTLIPTEMKKLFETYKKLDEAFNNLNPAQYCPPFQVRSSEEEFIFDGVKFCRKNICYADVPPQYSFSGPVSQPLSIGNHVFLLGISNDGTISLYVFDKDTGLFIKRIEPAISIPKDSHVLFAGFEIPLQLDESPFRISIVGTKLFVHNKERVLTVNPFTLTLEEMFMKKKIFKTYNPEVFSQLEKEYQKRDKKYDDVDSIMFTQLLLGNGPVRNYAVTVLEKMGAVAKAAIPQLTHMALSNSNFVVRLYAGNVLNQMGEAAKEAIPNLTQALSDSNPEVRSNAAEALGKMGEVAKEAIPQLGEKLSDQDPRVRSSAAEALGEMGEEAKQAIPQLIEKLSDQHPSVRSSAAEALGKMGPSAKETISQLTQMAFSDSEGFVRSFAAIALGNMGEAAKQAIPYLIKALSDPNPDIRSNAALTLAEMRQAEYLNTPYYETEDLPGVDVMDLSIRDQEKGDRGWGFNNMQDAARDTVPHLIKALSDPELNVRRSAAGALGTMGEATKEAIPHLIKALSDPDLEIRMNAAIALRNVGEAAKEALPELKKLLADPNLEPSDNNTVQEAIRKIEAQSSE